MSLNTVYLMGNLARDPETKVVNVKGRPTTVVFAVLAVTRFFKKNDEFVEQTDFIPCEAWDSGAERMAEKCSKGDRVLFEGRLKVDSWTRAEDGQKCSKMLVRVEKFHMLNKKGPRVEDNDSTD